MDRQPVVMEERRSCKWGRNAKRKYFMSRYLACGNRSRPGRGMQVNAIGVENGNPTSREHCGGVEYARELWVGIVLWSM